MQSNSKSMNGTGEWKVPRSRAHLFNREIEAEILQAVQPALFGDYWQFPELLRKFEQRFSHFIELPYVAAVQSGSAALYLSLRALELQSGDEVITVANSDMSTTSAIANCGAVPVLCDIKAGDYTIDPQQVEALITERTRGILPVDLYGHPADVQQLREIARKHSLFIVEDAALATAAKDYGRPMGAFADLTCFSTCSTKQIGAIGNGGMIATADTALREKLEMYRNYGVNPASRDDPRSGMDQHVDGFNLKMSPVDATVVTVKMNYLEEWTRRRKEIGARYEARLQDRDGIALPEFRADSEPVRREFVLRVRNRDTVFNTLREGGIQVGLNYWPPAHLRKAYRGRHLPGSDRLPVTEAVSAETVSLPVDPMLTDAEIDYVCDQLIAAVQR